MRYGEETIEQVRQAVDLVGLIGSQVQLRKTGQTWKGRCPFHNEKTPSFTVNPDRQAYHCFGCGAGGDAFRFVMETEKLSFVEALRSLAERYGVTLPEAAEEDAAGRLYKALEDAQTFFRRALEDPETGRAAREYLARRDLDEEILRRFGVGLAPPGWDALSSRLLSRHGQAVLLEAGLVIRRERGEGVYDRFRGRVIVPLRLPSGRVVGFGGRSLGDEEPKYLNSPETPLYRKSRFLFGLDQARAALKARDEAVLVEGYFDVIGLAQAGIEEAVATAGTALTADQCRLLRRYVPRLLLVFDGDPPGQAAAEKALGPVVGAGFEARVASLPPGQDPDSLVRGADGGAAWARVVAESVSPIEFVARRHAGAREEALRAAARLAAQAEDPITARLLIEEAARRLSFDETALGREVERLRGDGRGGPSARPGTARTRGSADAAGGAGSGRAAGTDGRGAGPGRPGAGAMSGWPLEASFLAVLIAHPELIEEAARTVEPAWFRSDEGRALAELLLGPERREAQAVLADPELAQPVRERLAALMATARALAEPDKALTDGRARLRQRALEDERARIQSRMRQALGDPGARDELLTLQRRMQDTAAALRAMASEARRKERA